MNIMLKKNKLQFYESIWRNSIIIKKYDIDNKPFPFPIKKNKKLSKKYLNFIYKLNKIENILIKLKKFKKYKKKKNCLITKKKNIGNKIFNLFGVNWDNTLIYYMINFNITPSSEFYNFIKNIIIKKKKLSLNSKFKFRLFKFKGNIFKRFKNKYVSMNKNDFRILDALFNDGSKKLYNYNDELKYSEHSGLIDFNLKRIDRIIINTKNYIDKNDDELFFPENMIDEADYEFIFHTHPKTKNRFNDGIIFEFPSIEDLINYGQNFNEGFTQGSLIIAPEGLYIITTIDYNFKIKIPKNKEKNILEDKLNELNFLSFNKYKNNYNNKFFYTKIIKDHSFIKLYNKFIQNLNIKIKFYNRIKFKNNYILPNVSFKLNIIETK